VVHIYRRFEGSYSLHLQSSAVQEEALLGMLNPENEGTMNILNDGKYLPIGMPQYPRNLEP